MLGKKFDKYVEAVIKRLRNLQTDLEIDDFLRDRGVEVDERHLIIKTAQEELDKMSGRDKFFPDKKIVQKKTDVDEDFIEDIESKKAHPEYATKDHKVTSILSLFGNVIMLFSTNIHKYFALFAIYFVVYFAAFFATQYDQDLLSFVTSMPVVGFFVVMFFISLVKFIGNDNEGVLFSIKYAFQYLIQISITLSLASFVILTLAGIGNLVYFNDYYLDLAIRTPFILGAFILSSWYFLTIFIMVNEEVFYINAIAKSRKYVNNKLRPYLVRFLLFIITAVLLAILLIFLFSLINFNGIKFPDAFFNINHLIPTNIDIETFGVYAVAIFILTTWIAIFSHSLYQDFAMEDGYDEASLSGAHQHLFFILLVLSPFLLGSSLKQADCLNVNYVNEQKEQNCDEIENDFEEENERNRDDNFDNFIQQELENDLKTDFGAVLEDKGQQENFESLESVEE